MTFRGIVLGVVSAVALAVPLSAGAGQSGDRCDVLRGRSNETIIVGRLLLGADEADRGAVHVVDGRISGAWRPGMPPTPWASSG